MSDRRQELQALAPILDRLPTDPQARVHYELMSDSLIWSDELPPPSNESFAAANCMRGVFRFRTTLILGKPEDKFRAGWEQLLGLCPKWPGFLPERRQADAARVRFFEEARARLQAEWEALDVKYESRRSGTAEGPRLTAARPGEGGKRP